MMNISTKLFRNLTSGSYVILRYLLSRVLTAILFGRTEPFLGSGPKDEHLYEVILNLGQQFRRRWYLKKSLRTRHEGCWMKTCYKSQTRAYGSGELKSAS